MTAEKKRSKISSTEWKVNYSSSATCSLCGEGCETHVLHSVCSLELCFGCFCRQGLFQEYSSRHKERMQCPNCRGYDAVDIGECVLHVLHDATVIDKEEVECVEHEEAVLCSCSDHSCEDDIHDISSIPMFIPSVTQPLFVHSGTFMFITPYDRFFYCILHTPYYYVCVEVFRDTDCSNTFTCDTTSLIVFGVREDDKIVEGRVFNIRQSIRWRTVLTFENYKQEFSNSRLAIYNILTLLISRACVCLYMPQVGLQLMEFYMKRGSTNQAKCAKRFHKLYAIVMEMAAIIRRFQSRKSTESIDEILFPFNFSCLDMLRSFVTTAKKLTGCFALTTSVDMSSVENSPSQQLPKSPTNTSSVSDEYLLCFNTSVTAKIHHFDNQFSIMDPLPFEKNLFLF